MSLTNPRTAVVVIVRSNRRKTEKRAIRTEKESIARNTAGRVSCMFVYGYRVVIMRAASAAIEIA